MKYRTRFPTCDFHVRYTSGRLDTTLSLQNPSKVPSRRTSPWFACKTDNLPHVSERESHAVDEERKKKKFSANMKRLQMLKIQMKAASSHLTLQEKKKSLLNPLSSGNINTLGVPEIMQLSNYLGQMERLTSYIHQHGGSQYRAPWVASETIGTGNPFPNSQEMQKKVQRRYWLGN